MAAPSHLPPLRDAFDSPERKRAYVRGLFATIADRYDLITVLLSFGLDRRWKNRLVALSGAGPGKRALDLACGTGDIAFQVAASGARTTGLDVTTRMLQLARAKAPAGPASFVAGDMMALPFPEHSFDLVTSGYGLRNVPAIEPALAEISRSAEQSAALMRQRYEQGVISLGDSLEAERQRLLAEANLRSAVAALTASYVAIQKSLGLGWSDVQ